MQMQWKGVMPAITTSFTEDNQIDHDFIAEHCAWLVKNGCSGIVALGSLGEGATLEDHEKKSILETCIRSVGKQIPIVAGIASLSTEHAISLAQMAAEAGCKGLMVLPPYIYSSEWREMKVHIESVFRATDLSCMLYNNPIAYSTDFLPEHIQELALENKNFHAVKESSTDVRRVTAIRSLLAERLEVFVGVDDVIVEGINAGAVGWIAGLVNAFPRESVELFNLAAAGETEKAFELYTWFLPLLRLDTKPKLVQYIKLAQQEAGMGNARVRAPRLELIGAELEETMSIIKTALENRPQFS